MGLATAPRALTLPDELKTLPKPIRRYRPYILVPLLYAGLTVVLLWPLVTHLRSAVPDTLGDPLLNAWTLRWVQHALVTDPAHLYNGNMFAPNPRSLAFSELLLPQAILAWPVWLMTHDSLLAMNLMTLLTYPMCAVAMYALCRALGAVRGAAFLAGVCYAFAPFRLDNTAHLQVLSMQWMPLALLAIIRHMQRPTRWSAIAVTLTVMLVALSSVYYLMMFGTGLAVFLIVEAIRQRRFFWSRATVGLIVALALAGIVVAALDVPYLTMRREQGIVRTLDEAYDDAAHSASYLTVTPGNFVWKHTLPTSGAEHAALFPGALLLICAALGLRTVRRPWMLGILALGLVSFILSFGPTWGAKESGTPLPYRLLYEHVVGFKGIRGPDRFAALVLLALAVFAAMGATWIWEQAVWRMPALRRSAAAFAVGIAVLASGECATRFLPMAHVDTSARTLAVYQWLATQSDTGTVAEFPVETAQLTTAFYSTDHWQPVLWGHSGFIPAPTYQLRARFVGKDDWPGHDDVDALADMGVRTLVIHRDAYTPAALAKIRADLAGEANHVFLIATVGDSDVYHLTQDPTIPALTASVKFNVNPAGNLDTLPGELLIGNPGTDARMLYTHGTFDLTAEIRDANGKAVSEQPVPITMPAVFAKGSTMVPLSVALPATPGAYTVSLRSAHVPLLASQPTTTVTVISLTTLPHLTLENDLITSPAMYQPGELVAMWVTTKAGKTIALQNTTALPDGTIRTAIPTLQPDATQVVAHGTLSGVELWVAPP